MAIQPSVSAHSRRPDNAGFTVSVRLPPTLTTAGMLDLVEAAQALSELTQEWFPQAEVRASYTSSTQEPTAAVPPRPSIYERLPQAPADEQYIVVGVVDVTINGRPLNLSPQELNLFRCLATRRDEVVSRQHIITCAWANQVVNVGSRTIDVHIRRLREKTQLPDLFSTVRGQGYRLNSVVGRIVVEPR